MIKTQEIFPPMTVSRRSFVRSGTAVVVSTLVPLGTTNAFGQKSQPSVVGNKASGLSTMTMETFRLHLNTYFAFTLGRGRVATLELVEVADSRPLELRQASAYKGKECFVLSFVGPKPLEQAVYTLEHNRLGSFQLLVVPGGAGSLGFVFEAVINRLAP
jgi:hypothetical protein